MTTASNQQKSKSYPTAGAYSGAAPSFNYATKTVTNITVNTSILPYMRPIAINFGATGLKPDSRIYPFFDGTDIRFNIASADVLAVAKLTTVPVPTIEAFKFSSYAKVSQTVTGGIASGSVMQCRNGQMHVLRDPNSHPFVPSGNPLEFVWNETTNGISQSINTTFTVSSVVMVSSCQTLITNGSTASWLLTYEVASPFNHTSIQVTLDDVIQVYGTNWTLDGPGQNLLWVGSPPTNIHTLKVYFPWAIRTDDNGYLSGVFNVPTATFKTGDRILRLIDSADGQLNDSTSHADYTFQAAGLQVTNTTSTSTQIISIRPPICNNPPGPPIIIDGVHQLIPTPPEYSDPLAQSFIVDGTLFSNGVFLESVDLCFRYKDPAIPIKVELRAVVNGYPSSTEIIPGSTVILDPNQVNVTGIIGQIALPGVGFTVDGELVPSFSDPRTFTHFKFQFPIFLKPDTEYALVIRSDSDLYHTFIARVGDTQLGSTNKVTAQPYAGSLFLSQNSSTWTADQTADLMFRLNQCVFDLAGSMTVEPKGMITNDDFTYDSILAADANLEIATATSVSYGLETTDDTSGLKASTPITLFPRQSLAFPDRQRLSAQSTLVAATTGQTVYTVPYLNVSIDEIDVYVVSQVDYVERALDKSYYYLRTKVGGTAGQMQWVWNSAVQAPPVTGTYLRFVTSMGTTVNIGMTTTDQWVSPVIDLSKFSMTFVHNEINAGQINVPNIKLPDPTVTGNTTLASPSITLTTGTGGSLRSVTMGGYLCGVIIDSGGSGYTTSSATVDAAPGGGITATISLIVNGGGTITGATITNQGSGYHTTTIAVTSATGSGAVIFPIVTQGTAGNSSSGSVTSWYIPFGGVAYTDNYSIALVRYNTTNYQLTVVNECAATGGNCITRYISSRVTLVDGFDAQDIQVYLTAMKPVGTTVDVYYKVLSSADNTDWSASPWVAMVSTGDVQSLNTEDYKEMQFNTAGGSALYGGFTNFKMFAIKIVLTAQNTSAPPRIHDLRAIALATTF